ncbi:MAG TPA: hypothetical protein VN903_09890, partial [Polyangia bacterium]|nr:hypothetical protein [Polyangia bacterium]
VNGVAVPYIAACACPDFLGSGWDPVDERTAALSHELIEAAADPYPISDPAYSGANQANLIWTVITGGELTDMCTVQPDAYFRPSGASHMVSRSWSNAAARAGDDPCVPPPSSTIPYFNSMPVLDTIPYGDTGYWTQGLQIPIGTSRTIDLDLFSTAAVPHDWNVAVYPYEDFYGGTRSINVSTNKTSGKNGDIIRLTISALRQNPTFGMSPFIIMSTYGSPSDADYRSHVSMGLVTNY